MKARVMAASCSTYDYLEVELHWRTCPFLEDRMEGATRRKSIGYAYLLSTCRLGAERDESSEACAARMSQREVF